MYPTATRSEILAELPGREWTAISKYARHKLGLHRTKKAKGEAVRSGRWKTLKKEEKSKSD